ncbi:unnamed protein product [Durusdinium trenchii]|uniref:phospholipase D n=1 Tax=Durusdinium trenchii TaxID=1381693 RepID=A0ABP0NIE1_9DINO
MCAALAVHCLIHWLVSTSCLFAFVCFVHVWLHSRSSSGSPHPGRPAMADGERSRRSCESEARRRSATTEGRLRVSQSLSPWEMEKSPKTSKTKTLLSQLERQHVRLRQEIEGWRTFLQTDSTRSQSQGPELLAVEPIMDETDSYGRSNRQQYKAHLQLRQELGVHSWSTEPFTLDELLRIVVRTRAATARKWCLADTKWRSIWEPEADTFSSICWTLATFTLCFARGLLFWSWLCGGSWLLATLLRPTVHQLLQTMALVMNMSIPEAFAPLDLLSFGLAMALMGFGTLLTAGLTEVSFLPAKAILSLERKAETEKVREQLAILLRSDCCSNLDICNFLSLGMATYFNSSETHKEGRCFVRRHETAEDYFMKRRRRHCSICCLRCDCRLQLRLEGRSSQERWLVLRKDGIALFNSMMDSDPTDMLFFDTSFGLFRDEEDHVLVKGASWVLELSFGDQSQHRRQMSAQGWCNAITLTAQLSARTRQQRFGSYAPLRMPGAPKQGDRHLLRQCFSRYLINGRAIFRSVAEAIMMARHEIFILSFFMSPHIELVREGAPLAGADDCKVSTLLKSAAERGVRVYVLLYHETMNLVPNDSGYAEAELKHPNIFVMRHRSRFDSNLLWTHHEKVVVVDQQLAIVGGLDLCIGRYDDWQHRIADSDATLWQGQDYYNPRIKDVTEGRLQNDLLQRTSQPRLPWQDVACELLGRPARDVARHCVERWNHARFVNSIYEELPVAMLRRKMAVTNDKMVTLPAQASEKVWPPEQGPWQVCRAQVIRSVGRWSAGTKTESSTHQAYCDLIQDSKYFIYIENQFFCSGMEGDINIGNRVLEALYRRVMKAHEHGERFHVVIVLPLLPALEAPLCQANASSPVFRVMHAQYCTLRGLRSRLRAGGIDAWSPHISIFGLRTHGFLPGLGPATEQIYIHSKAMVIDDEVALVGSSNINDRSLLGMRDSEVNVVIQDEGLASLGPAFRGGCPANLRKALFAQHLGLNQEKLEDAKLIEMSSITSNEMPGWARCGAWQGVILRSTMICSERCLRTTCRPGNS